MSDQLYIHLLRYALSRITPAAVGVLTLTMFTSYLAPVEYGTAAVFLSTCAIAVAIFFSYIQNSTLRYWSRFEGEGRLNILAGTIITLFVFSVVLLATIMLLDFFLLHLIDVKFRIYVYFVFSTTAIAGKLLLMDVARARLKPDEFRYIAIGSSLLLFGLGAGFLTLGFGYESMILAQIGSDIAPSLYLAMQLRRVVRPSRFDWTVAAQCFSYGLPLTGVTVMNSGLYSGSRILVLMLTGPAAAGIYAAAYDLGQRLVTVSVQVVNLASWPLIVREYDLGHTDNVRILFQNNLALLAAFGIPAVVIAGVGGDDLAKLVLGQQFAAEAITILPYVAIATFLGRFKVNHLDFGFMLHERTQSQMLPILIMTTLGLGLTWLFVPHQGTLGAAQAVLLAYAVGAILSWLLTRNHIHVLYLSNNLFITILGGILMALALAWSPTPTTRFSSLITLIIALVIYLITLFIFNFSGVRKFILCSLNHITLQGVKQLLTRKSKNLLNRPSDGDSI